MKTIAVILCLILSASITSGCAPAVALSGGDDRATLEIVVRGEPEQDEIVVWADPKHWPRDAPTLWPTIDLARRDLDLKVVGRWNANIENFAEVPKPLIVRSADGTITNFGPHSPNSVSMLAFGVPGSVAYYELLSARQDQVVARVLVVPSVYARSVRANERVTFDNLLPGPCKINCWFAQSQGKVSTVQLVAGKVTRVTLTAPSRGSR